MLLYICIRQETRIATNTAIAAQIMTMVALLCLGDNVLVFRLSGNTQSSDSEKCLR